VLVVHENRGLNPYIKDVARRLAKAQVRDSLERPPLTAIEACRWFVRRPGKQRDVKQLRGPWSFSISPTKTDIELRSYFDELTEADIPPEEYEYWLPETEVLLAAGDGSPLMMRVTQLDWSDSQILVVSNGSFLLNYPLVNHEHRKLAGMLIDQCGGGDGRTAIFLEGATSEVAVRESEPSAQDKISSAMLRQWPLNVILLHLIVLGIIYCIARSPIFGRPREAPAASTTDFAAHIDALGRQLSRTRDSAYAQERVEHFRQLMRRE